MLPLRAIKKIEDQLPDLAAKFKIYDADEETIIFCPSSRGSNPSMIEVQMGEIHLGTDHTFVFDIYGELHEVWRSRFSESGALRSWVAWKK